MWSTFTLNARSFKLYSQLLSWSNLQDSFIKLSFLRIIEIKLLLNWNKASGWFFLNHAEYFMLLVWEISLQRKRMVPLVQPSTNCGQCCIYVTSFSNILYCINCEWLISNMFWTIVSSLDLECPCPLPSFGYTFLSFQTTTQAKSLCRILRSGEAHEKNFYIAIKIISQFLSD